MKNKIIIFLTLVLFLAPISVHAQKILHTTVYTDQGDGTFHFSVATYLMGSWWSDGFFDVITNNQSGTGPDENVSEAPPGYNPAYYFVEETVPANYTLSKIDCYCDNGYHTSGIFSYSGGRVYIYPTGDSSASCSSNFYCDFYNKKIRTPVLIVPGITGTEMQKGSELLWPDIDRMFTDSDDSFMDALTFDQNNTPSDPLVSATKVITTGKLFGATVYNYTDGLINEFKNQGYTEGQMLFTFPYDWRYGVSGKNADGKTNSDLLRDKISQILSQTGASKVDVVAHSMGGLIVKKYVQDNPSSHSIGKTVFVGVPNTGAPQAVKALVQGDNFGVGFGPVGLNDAEMKKLAQNMPGVYDLLPSQKYYDVAGSFVRLLDNTADSSHGDFSISDQTIVSDLNYSETKSFLVDDNNLNSQALVGAENLHTQAFDDFDMRNVGVDLYSIDGCKTGTTVKLEQSKVTNLFGQTTTSYAPYKINTGDGTVPIESSTNLPIDQAKKYYVLTGKHSRLLAQDGSRQEIVNLVSGSSLAIAPNLLTQDVSQCQLNGKAIIVYSPVDVSVTDQNENQLGLSNGNTTNEIPNADFQIWGDHKLVYLSTDYGQTYTINLQGIDMGTYTINVQSITDNKVAKAEIFRDLPVTPALSGQVDLSGNTTTLSLNNSPVPILPTQVFDYAADKTAPEAVIQFNPAVNDLKFSGVDNLSDSPSIVINDNGNTVVLTDEAGNTTELNFSQRNRRSAMSADLASVKYNGVQTVVGSNLFSYSWSFDKSGKLAKLTQKVKSRNNYSITAIYDGTTTKLTGSTSAGRISQSFPGLKILKVTTNMGDLSWSY